MPDRVIASIKKIIALNQQQEEALRAVIKTKKIKRKEYVLREGQVCNYATFIVNGSLRYYYLIDGEEYTGQFFFEDSWYADFESYLTGKPSNENIEALEDCEILLLYKHDLESLYVQHPIFEKFGRVMVENAFLGLKNKNKMLTLESPEERYLSLLNDRPLVFKRVPLKYIASYLSIQPESLSRIRKRLYMDRNS